jgi:hypothetical protein
LKRVGGSIRLAAPWKKFEKRLTTLSGAKALIYLRDIGQG